MLPEITFLRRMVLHIDHVYNNRYSASSTRPKRIAIKLGIGMTWAFENVHTIFSRKHIAMPYLEIMVTERCNLRCKKCSNLMPLFQSPKDAPVELLLSDIDRILASVDKIYLLKVLGGEPFLYRPLSQLLAHIADHPKIERIEIVTNGTLMPKAEVLPSLRHKKIKVIVSPYSRVIAKNAHAMIAMFEENHIQYGYPELEAWKDFGDFTPRNRSAEQNTAMFSRCFMCVTLINGEIFCCPRAGNGAALGLVPKRKGEYVTVRNNDPAAIMQELYDFSKLTVISTCDYCDNPGPIIPIAEQIE